ncbi:MAG: CIA30 family protein, partial [Pseudomonadota bacterium]
MILEDFQGDVADWQYVSDRVMGGVSDGTAVLETEGETTFARLTGEVSTANNGGFVQMRRVLPDNFPPDATGLNLVVRGNGEPYYIHLRTQASRRPWQFFQASFPSTNTWQDVVLTWDDFRPQGGLNGSLLPEDVISIGVVAYGRDHQADLSVASIAVLVPE